MYAMAAVQGGGGMAIYMPGGVFLKEGSGVPEDKTAVFPGFETVGTARRLPYALNTPAMATAMATAWPRT